MDKSISLLTMFISISGCIITYYVGWNSRIQSSAILLYEHFYHPVYSVLKNEIDRNLNQSEKVLINQKQLDTYKRKIYAIIYKSNGIYPDQILGDLDDLTVDNFYNFCKIINKSYIRCKNRAHYLALYPVSLKYYRLYISLTILFGIFAITSFFAFFLSVCFGSQIISYISFCVFYISITILFTSSTFLRKVL